MNECDDMHRGRIYETTPAVALAPRQKRAEPDRQTPTDMLSHTENNTVALILHSYNFYTKLEFKG